MFGIRKKKASTVIAHRIPLNGGGFLNGKFAFLRKNAVKFRNRYPVLFLSAGIAGARVLADLLVAFFAGISRLTLAAAVYLASAKKRTG
ncbi:MAG: hypothetical protein GF350_07495 [Chitinivibrionales bacterium]|nr:hypothetical protein [Chitinivibrionales bacterium]